MYQVKDYHSRLPWSEMRSCDEVLSNDMEAEVLRALRERLLKES